MNRPSMDFVWDFVPHILKYRHTKKSQWFFGALYARTAANWGTTSSKTIEVAPEI